MAQVVFLIFGIILLVFFLCLLLNGYWYPATLVYHYVAEHEDFEEYMKALKLVKNGTTLQMVPLTYLCSSGLYDQYLTQLADTYNLVVHEDGPALYKGGKLILTSFSRTMVARIAKLAGHSEKEILVMRLLEMDSDRLTYPNFMEKYFPDRKGDRTITLQEFMDTYIKAKREELLANKTEK